MRPLRLIAPAAAVLVAAALFVGVPPASAGGGAEPVVTTTSDVVDAGDGLLSLREAVTEMSGAGGGNIFLLPGEEHVLDRCGGADDTNAQGDLDLDVGSSAVAIIGDGAMIRQTCLGERVLDVDAGTVQLLDVTITGGRVSGADPDGGGMRADADYVLVRDGSRVVDNHSAGSGGGIFANGQTALSEQSTVADNVADGSGGGLWGTNVVLDVATVSGNFADGAGGGIYSGSNTILQTATIAENSSSDPGGAVYTQGSAFLVQSTVIDNLSLDPQGGASIEAGSIIGMDGTVLGFVSDPGTTVACSEEASGLASYTTDASCGLSGGNGNVDDGPDPQLGPLADNGGLTLTMAPLPGSPLRDVVAAPGGSGATCDLAPDAVQDQRTVPRPQGGGCDIGAVETPLPFNDVGVTHPFFEDINTVLFEQITTGYPDGGYRPSASVTRQAMAAFLFRLADAEGHVPGPPTFDDVSGGHPFFTEIDWLVSEEITTGYGDGTFRPGGLVTRQAIAAFLYRLAGSDFEAHGVPTFSDVGVPHPFYDEIGWLSFEELTNGYPDGTFRPGNTMTRQAMAAFLARTIDANVLM